MYVRLPCLALQVPFGDGTVLGRLTGWLLVTYGLVCNENYFNEFRALLCVHLIVIHSYAVRGDGFVLSMFQRDLSSPLMWIS